MDSQTPAWCNTGRTPQESSLLVSLYTANVYSESRMCQNGQCTQVGTYARAAGPPGLALWHEPSRQIGRASDDVQTLFYAQPSAGMPDSCMAREWKKSRLGSFPMLPSPSVPVACPRWHPVVASLSNPGLDGDAVQQLYAN
ncbi:uncharacterized protein TrAtP1_003531 [Trichoderma atroviride]|uniref:uncharacterized protein n=1 Tax=Hypocrea atroviridis TaxID=63577 RepID=UPI003331F2D7|nr:hypothetical protein TrAtP1_003531 [Trichoderma atroviride]